MVGVLFVCMGNICRSPLAEGVFRHLAEAEGLIKQGLFCDSAGTSGYHIGQAPDRRSIEVGAKYGIDIRDQRARGVTAEDFERFHYILAMDRDNLGHLRSRAPSGLGNKVQLYLKFARDNDFEEVPDPYYGGDRGFELCFELARGAAEGLLKEIVRDHFPEHGK